MAPVEPMVPGVPVPVVSVGLVAPMEPEVPMPVVSVAIGSVLAGMLLADCES